MAQKRAGTLLTTDPQFAKEYRLLSAAVHADQEKLDTYLEVYDTIVSESRSYPLHTATAG